MSALSDDLLYVANACSDANRANDAIDVLKRLISLNPRLDLIARSSFLAIHKKVIEKYRNNLMIFDTGLHDRERQHNQSGCDSVSEMRARVRGSLRTFCTDTIALINSALLPHADGVEAQVFFHKMIGDLYRYLCEMLKDTAHALDKDQAKAAYLAGLEIAQKLPAFSPIRLETVLNHGILLATFLSSIEEAIDRVREALYAARGLDHGELSPESRKRLREVLKAMDHALSDWSKRNGSSSSEEDEEA
jgi:14-3-3 protein epsilon